MIIKYGKINKDQLTELFKKSAARPSYSTPLKIIKYYKNQNTLFLSYDFDSILKEITK